MFGISLKVLGVKTGPQHTHSLCCYSPSVPTNKTLLFIYLFSLERKKNPEILCHFYINTNFPV